MEHKLSKIFVRPSDSIKKVMAQMLENKSTPGVVPGLALVVDAKYMLQGIVTNGDIRRAFAEGITADSAISKVMNQNPSVIERPRENADVLAVIFDKIKEGKWPKDRLEKIIIVDDRQQILDVVSFYDLVQKSDVRFKHIGIVGLGYVGLTLGLTLADVHFKVKGFDINRDIADSIRRKTPHFYEAGLDTLLHDHLDKNFRIVSDFHGPNNCDVYFIAVGTPLTRENKPDLRYLEDAAKNLGKVLKQGDAVILRSTVPLGTTRNVVTPILEQYSGLKAGEDFHVAFAPERTIEGKALEELRRLPQVIGGISRSSCDLAAGIFNFLTRSTVLVDSLEEAEMVKLVNNTYRDVTFGFANEVSLIAQKWGIDTKRVLDAANYGYERSNIPMPSPGVGGYCLEKDPFIFIDSAKAKGYEPMLMRDARITSNLMIESVIGRAVSFLRREKSGVKQPKIMVLGFAFKGRPVTSDVRGSMAVRFVKSLQEHKFGNIHVFDPAVRRQDIINYGVTCVTDLEKGFRDADVIAVMTNHPDFEAIEMRSLLKLAKKPVLFLDGWAVYEPDEMAKVRGVDYKRL